MVDDLSGHVVTVIAETGSLLRVLRHFSNVFPKDQEHISIPVPPSTVKVKEQVTFISKIGWGRRT